MQSTVVKLVGSAVVAIALASCSFTGTEQAPVTRGTSYAKIHVVEPGDTLYSIAQLYGTTPEKIAEENGLTDPSKLSVGQELGISVGSSDEQ